MKVAWDDSLSTGIDEIDDQHKRIFDTFNTFSSACTEGLAPDKVNELFWFLGSYVAIHFVDEERLMMNAGFPDYERHHEQHSAFATEIDALMGRFLDEGPSHELVSTVGTVVRDWLLDHISLMDRGIGMYLRETGKMC